MRIAENITAEVVIDDFAGIKQALMDPNLSRTFDKRTYASGNVREGVVSIMHGQAHRDRRRLENLQFRPDHLKRYELELFPPIVESMVAEAATVGEADLFHLGERLAIVLAAKRAGFDFDLSDHQAHEDIVGFVDEFSQASAIVDAKDPEAIRVTVKKAHVGFHEQFGIPSIARRLEALASLERGEIGEEDLPHDILTSLLRHRDDPKLGLSEDSVIVREAGTYLQGGTHTSSQTLINAVDLLLENRAVTPDSWERVKEDLAFAQRCMHETLRLRPTTPKAKRRAEADTMIGDAEIPQGALVILDLAKANRDPQLFGDDAMEFNPDRDIPSRNPLWGLSFGAGPHICPGRKVAGGLQQTNPHAELPDQHLYGLVARMIQSVVQRDPGRHPSKPQSKDDRTERFTRWREYWTVFGSRT